MGKTVVYGDFEWDEDKDWANKRKHGIGFEEATQVFADHAFFEVPDEEHSTLSEQRFLGYGVIRGFVVVTTVYTYRGRKRFISARRATKEEEKGYYEQRYGY